MPDTPSQFSVPLDEELLRALPGMRVELERQLKRQLSLEESATEALRFLAASAELLREDSDGGLGREILLAIQRMHDDAT